MVRDNQKLLPFSSIKRTPNGGRNFNIQIDESLFRGKIKSNRGRLLKGDKKPKESVMDKLRSIVENNESHRNYGNRVTGPWVFGMILQDKKDLQTTSEISKFNHKISKRLIEGHESREIRKSLYKDKRKLNTKANRIYNAIEARKFKRALFKEANVGIKELRMFYVPKRDAKNLVPIIVSNCQSNSEVVSDEWRAYRRLKNHGFKHFTVNHSKNFVDPKTKRHTQLIECLWNVAKSKLIKRSRGIKESKLPGYLAEEWFRSIHIEKNGPIIFESILDFVKKNPYEKLLRELKIKLDDFDKYKNEFNL